MPPRVGVVRKPVHHRLGHVGDHRQATGHIAVQRAVAHRDLAFVARAQHQRAELVRQRHQQVAPDARLDILLGHVRRPVGKDRRERL